MGQVIFVTMGQNMGQAIFVTMGQNVGHYMGQALHA